MGISIPPQQNSNCVGNNINSSNCFQPQSYPGEYLCVNSGKHSTTALDVHSKDFVFLAKNGELLFHLKYFFHTSCLKLDNFLVLQSIKNVTNTLITEKDRLKAAIDAETNVQNPISFSNNPTVVTSLKTSLNLVLQQNNELKSRLNRIHDISDLGDISSMDPVSDTVSILRISTSYSI